MLYDRGLRRVGLGVDAENPTGALGLYERAGMHKVRPGRQLGARSVSALRARCPDCRTLTAVAIGPEYQCHSCGREFAAGLVRVPRAWGDGGDAMAAAANMALPWPEAAVIDEATLDAQIEATARELPARPLVLGGCCCSHVGAVRELARRHGRLGVVWLDAHGDLEHARVVAVGQRVGDAAADADRRRRCRTRPT